MSYLVPFDLPSGGTAQLRTRLSHAATVQRRLATARLLPTKVIRKLQAVAGTDEETLDVLAAEDIELADALAAQDAIQIETIRLVVASWSGVHGADGAELTFPSDVPALDSDDFDALYVACERAIESGRADPNAGGAR